jgi:hypothetical protein
MPTIYGLTGRCLPVHPHPLPDELLTHWFLRLAHENHLKAQGLADYAFGQQSSFWARDQDREPSSWTISRLSDLTGQDVDAIEALTLAKYETVLFEHHNPNGTTDLVFSSARYACLRIRCPISGANGAWRFRRSAINTTACCMIDARPARPR